MALLFAESFDWVLDDFNGAGLTARSYSLGNPTSSMGRGTGRISGYAFRIRSSTVRFYTITKALPASYSTGYFSFSVLFENFSTLNVSDIIRLTSSSTVMLALQLDATGKLSVLRGGTSLEQTASAVLTLDTWHRIEFYFVIHDTTGAYELRVDGINVLSATDVDTRNGAPTTVDGFVFANFIKSAPAMDIYLDDITFNDTTGSVNHGFLGDLHIETVRPSADDSVTWTPSAGSDNYALVDDSAGLDTTDYITAATAIEDRYSLTDLAASPDTIFGVQTMFHGSKDDAGACNVRARVISGSDTADGAAHGVTTGGTIYTDIIETDPQGGGAWTGARVNAAKIGIERTV